MCKGNMGLNLELKGTGAIWSEGLVDTGSPCHLKLTLGYFGIEGSGSNGAGALQFLRNTDFATPITLTDDATIGIQEGATVTAKSTLNAESEESVLTVKGGTLKMTQSETGSLKHVNLESSQLQMAPDGDTAHFGFASVNLSEDSSLVFPAGKTINIGTPDDTEAFTTSVMGEGTFTIDSTLYLDAYTTDRGTRGTNPDPSLAPPDPCDRL